MIRLNNVDKFIEDIDAMNEENFYKKRCIFADESGFKKNMVRPVAWSKKAYGLIALSQQVPKSSRKKQKTPLGTKRALLMELIRHTLCCL